MCNRVYSTMYETFIFADKPTHINPFINIFMYNYIILMYAYKNVK